MIVSTFGAPGTGKSTYGRYIAARLGGPWISTGAVLREVARDDERIARIIASGALVPSEDVDRIMAERLTKLGDEFVLDGYPRTVPEAESFLEFLRGRSWRIARVYHFTAPDEVVIERLLRRGREDDRLEVIRERLRIYSLETGPVLQVLREAETAIVEVDNSRPMEEVQRELDASLRKLAGPEPC